MRAPAVLLAAATLVGGQYEAQVRLDPTIDPNAILTTVETLAGNGHPSTETFDAPMGIATSTIDATTNGWVYIADSNNHAIRSIAPDGRLRTLAGGNGPGLADGDCAVARFYKPSGVDVGPDGAIYVADSGNHAIRRLKLQGSDPYLAECSVLTLWYGEGYAAAEARVGEIGSPPGDYTWDVPLELLAASPPPPMLPGIC